VKRFFGYIDSGQGNSHAADGNILTSQGQAYGISVPLTLNTIMVQIDSEKCRDICPQKVE